MIVITGRTFEHRDLLKSMRGEFDQKLKRWEFGRLSTDQLAKLRGLVGLVITTVDDPAPPTPSDDDEGMDWLADLLKVDRRPNSKPSAMYGDDPTYHNQFADQNPSAFFGFSTLGKFVDYIDHIAPAQSGDDRRQGWNDSTADFYGTRTMRDALTLARDGWSRGVERALTAMERLSVANPRVPKRKASLAGGSVNVGRMLSGDPAHMIRRPKSPGRKVVTFFVEAGCNGYVKSESIEMRAALIGAMVDHMENSGYSCTIVAVDTSTENGRALYQLAVKLKEAGERLNLSDLMFALGHLSFLRRLSFATCSSVDQTRTIWGSQGSSSNSFDNEHRCGPGEYYVPVLNKNQVGTDPLYLLPHVIPDRLPVAIERMP